MFRLLGYQRLVRRFVQTVSSAAELFERVVFEIDLRIWSDSYMASRAHGQGIDGWDIRESVGIGIVAIPCASLAEYENACPAVIGNHRGINVGIVVECRSKPNGSEIVPDFSLKCLFYFGSFHGDAEYGDKDKGCR